MYIYRVIEIPFNPLERHQPDQKVNAHHNHDSPRQADNTTRTSSTSSTQESNSFHGFPTSKTFPPRLKPFEPAPLPTSSVFSPGRGLKGIGPRRQRQPT